MEFSGNIVGILFALTSALVWGSGDFSGGLASRKASSFAVLAISALSGIMVLIVCTLLWREGLPPARDAGWAMLGGVAGALGLAALYRALSMGQAASVAPTSGVIGAALPVVFSILTGSLPGIERLAGFLLAFLGIWLVSQSPAPAGAEAGQSGRPAFLLACLAGASFGAFFIFVGQFESGLIFSPLILTRSVTFVTALILLRANRQPFPALNSNPVALLAGALDAGGNIFYVLARQFTSLDVAAVLSSLYPASTVLLASLLMKEKIARGQWLGVLICLAAIILITR
jgi:drug/metabolite transporter (DMT)-like permease